MSARPYAKVLPDFWTNKIGKVIRNGGPETQVIALYLLTCHNSNMIGFYYLPKPIIAHETGLTSEAVAIALAKCKEAGFSVYDEESELIWVYDMAFSQIAEHLKVTDNQTIFVQRLYDDLPENPYLADFYDRYCGAFNMTKRRGGRDVNGSQIQTPSEPLASHPQAPHEPSQIQIEGPSESLRSQKQEQKQEQKNKSSQEQGRAEPDKLVDNVFAALKSAGISFRATDPRVVDLANRRIPMTIILAAIQKAKDSKGSLPVGMNYVLTIINRLEKVESDCGAQASTNLDEHRLRASNSGRNISGRGENRSR